MFQVSMIYYPGSSQWPFWVVQVTLSGVKRPPWKKLDDETFRNANVYYDFWDVLNSGLLAALVALFVTVHVMLCRYFEDGCCIFWGSSTKTWKLHPNTYLCTSFFQVTFAGEYTSVWEHPLETNSKSNWNSVVRRWFISYWGEFGLFSGSILDILVCFCEYKSQCFRMCVVFYSNFKSNNPRVVSIRNHSTHLHLRNTGPWWFPVTWICWMLATVISRDPFEGESCLQPRG